MAKKKQIELTIEEKLQNALVPKEEQPYKIPSNWCWVRLESINKYKSETLNPKNAMEKMFELYSVPSFDNKYPEILIGKDIGSNKYIVKKNDILLCKINPRINRVWQVYQHTNFGQICSSEWIVIRNEILNKSFLRYYFTSEYFRNRLCENVSGVGGSLTRAKPKLVQLYEVPLSPINEQQRIVNIIESLFAKLDRAKELIENTLAQFEQNKMAILHKAFTGELTAKWRKENNINNIKDVSYIEKLPYIVPNGWYWDKLENITIRIVDGDHNPPAKEKEKTSYIMLSAQNIGYSSFINMDKVRYLSKDNFDKCHKRTCLEDGDILFSSVGSIGNAMVYREKENDKITFQRSVTIIKTKINPYYLRYVLLSPYCQQIFKTESIGTAQKGFYIKQMKNLIVPVPTIEEQQEIVNILDRLLAKYNKIKNLEQQLEKIELLKKAILAKAFRGELGTNNPDEESAENLLKEILAEK